jgi:hypothetical protein
VAIAMEITPEAALMMRLRYLTEELEWWDNRNPKNELESALIASAMLEIMVQRERIRQSLHGMRPKNREEAITEEMIERARNYPVDRLIEFTRGKALCFNHQEKTPSLNHDKARNRAKCFGSCGRSWDAIDIVRVRDGLSFRDAVKQLQ